MNKSKLIIGQEYEACNQFATLIRIEGNTAVLRNRWDTVFETEIGNVREKPIRKFGTPPMKF